MESNWKPLIEQIQQGDVAAENDLFHLVQRCVRPVALRQLGPADAEDSVHDVFIIVLNTLRSQKLRDPERLGAYIGAVFKFRRWRRWQTAAATVDAPVESLDLEGGKTPELMLRETENRNLVRTALSSCTERDRDILVRFYVNEQEREQICREMDLTPTQFRLLKSRAKDRFARIGRRLLQAPAATMAGAFHGFGA
jgi:RNA polymerase sigma-70 factor (ECF subfamily)